MTTCAHSELLILGAGPAGLGAALQAAPSGMSITVVDDNPQPGGQIWRAQASAQAQGAALLQHPGVRLHCGTRLVARTGARQVLLENAQGAWEQRYDKLILCSGARELLLPFPGWTLPGVSGAGGLQALIKGGMPVRGERIVVAGSGPLLLAVAQSARAAGAEVLRVAEQARGAALARFAAALWRWPDKLLQAARLGTAAYRTDSYVLQAQGGERLESVLLQEHGQAREWRCTRLACGFGLVPNTEIGQLLGCALDASGALAVDAGQRTSLAEHWAAGECTGIGGSERAWLQGRIAACGATGDAAQAQALQRQVRHWDHFVQALAQHFALRPELRTLADAATVVCRCEDVRWGQLADCESWIDAKLHTRCGMGACQGRVCGAALQHLRGWSAPPPSALLAPVRLASLGATRPTDAGTP